jgi:class 3 adenylate cyclase
MSAASPRGTVTFLFSDIEGSTDLLRRVGDDAFAAINGHHRHLLRVAFEAQRGCEIDTAGDGFFVAFESASTAVAAAIGAQRALVSFGWPDGAEVRVRMGLHTAEPHLGDDGYVGVGVTRAARICAAAWGGQILVSNATAGIIEDAELPGLELVDLGEHRLKGLTRPQRLFQLSVSGLPSQFGPPRTPETEGRFPGAGTFVDIDIAGWSYVIRRLGDEASSSLAAEYHATVVGVVETNAGVVIERAGDRLLAVFRNAADALRAAAAGRDALRDFPWPPDFDGSVKIALHSGRWSGDPQRPEASTALFRLSRFARAVEPGQVLVSQTTADLLEGGDHATSLRSLGERVLPDFDEPVRVYELVDSNPVSSG